MHSRVTFKADLHMLGPAVVAELLSLSVCPFL